MPQTKMTLKNKAVCCHEIQETDYEGKEVDHYEVSDVLEAVKQLKKHVDEFTDKKGLISGRFVKIAIDKVFGK